MIKKILQQLPENFKSFATLVSGNILATIFPILIAPFLTRLYTEQEFGVYTIYISIVSIFCSFSTGRYDIAILEANNKSVAKHLAVLAFSFSVTISLIAFFSLYLFNILFSNLVSIQKFGALIYLVPFSTLVISALQTINYVLNREKEFGQMSLNKTIKAGSVSVTQLGGGYIDISFYGLAIGKLIGDIFAITHGVLQINKKKILFRTQVQLSRIQYVAKKYKNYLKINSFHSFVNIATTNSIPLILGYFFSESVVGFYGLSYSVCVLPLKLISQAAYQIFSREFSIRIDKGMEVLSYFKSTVFKLVFISLPIFSIIFIYGDTLFKFVFGANWIISGKIAQILAPHLFAVFVVSPFTFIALRLNKHVHIFRIELAYMILKISSIVLGSIYFNEFVALTFYSISGLLVNIYLIIWTFNQLRKI